MCAETAFQNPLLWSQGRHGGGPGLGTGYLDGLQGGIQIRSSTNQAELKKGQWEGESWVWNMDI